MHNRRMQPIVAIKALRRLIADPEQTHEVFIIVRALSGPALRDGFLQFAGTQTGRDILREKRSLLKTLQDREALASLAPNSLGRQYLSWVQAENLDADGLVEASDQGEFENMEPDMRLFGERQRDQHDLWHTLTRYGRDELGEACLLAFTYAQTKNRGVGAICVAGALKLSRHYGSGTFRAMSRAYKDGRKAAWLPGQDWEALLARPIDEVRQTLRIDPPQRYFDLRSPGTPAAA